MGHWSAAGGGPLSRALLQRQRWDQYRRGLDWVLGTALASIAVPIPILPITSSVPVLGLGFVLSGRVPHGSSGQRDGENLHGSMLITFKGEAEVGRGMARW